MPLADVESVLVTLPRLLFGGDPVKISFFTGPESQTITESGKHANGMGIIYDLSSCLPIEGGNEGCANATTQAAERALAQGLFPLTPAARG